MVGLVIICQASVLLPHLGRDITRAVRLSPLFLALSASRCFFFFFQLKQALLLLQKLLVRALLFANVFGKALDALLLFP